MLREVGPNVHSFLQICKVAVLLGTRGYAVYVKANIHMNLSLDIFLTWGISLFIPLRGVNSETY